MYALSCWVSISIYDSKVDVLFQEALNMINHLTAGPPALQLDAISSSAGGTQLRSTENRDAMGKKTPIAPI